MFITPAGRSLVLVLVCAAGVACGLSSSRLRLGVHVAPDANRDRPIPVDVVLVWDKKADAALGELPAKTWFEKKQQLRRDDPDQQAFAVHEWEWVPGQEVPDIELDVPADRWRSVRTVYIFANYPTDGAHRLRVTPGRAAVLELLKEDMRLQESSLSVQTP